MNDKNTLFIKKALSIHGLKYCYDEIDYIKSNIKINIKCNKHQTYFKQRPAMHLQGDGCPTCGLESKRDKFRLTTDQFIKKAQEIHNDTYTYLNTCYGNNNNTKVIITCKIHGDFEQTPRLHLSGKGCQSCALTNKSYTQEGFKKLCIKNNNGSGILYIIRCFNENESFYKVGITSRSIKERYKNKTLMPYNYKIIQETSDLAANIFIFELELKKKLSNYKYKPLIYFSGSATECFT
jgi:hypothetical protein